MSTFIVAKSRVSLVIFGAHAAIALALVTSPQLEGGSVGGINSPRSRQ